MILAQHIQNIISTCGINYISSAQGHVQFLDCAGVEWGRRSVNMRYLKMRRHDAEVKRGPPGTQLAQK